MPEMCLRLRRIRPRRHKCDFSGHSIDLSLTLSFLRCLRRRHRFVTVAPRVTELAELRMGPRQRPGAALSTGLVGQARATAPSEPIGANFAAIASVGPARSPHWNMAPQMDEGDLDTGARQDIETLIERLKPEDRQSISAMAESDLILLHHGGHGYAISSVRTSSLIS